MEKVSNMSCVWFDLVKVIMTPTADVSDAVLTRQLHSCRWHVAALPLPRLRLQVRNNCIRTTVKLTSSLTSLPVLLFYFCFHSSDTVSFWCQLCHYGYSISVSDQASRALACVIFAYIIVARVCRLFARVRVFCYSLGCRLCCQRKLGC